MRCVHVYWVPKSRTVWCAPFGKHSLHWLSVHLRLTRGRNVYSTCASLSQVYCRYAAKHLFRTPKNGTLKRHTYKAQFMLQVISYAVLNGNRAAARDFNKNESRVRKWWKQENELLLVMKSRQSFGGNCPLYYGVPCVWVNCRNRPRNWDSAL